MPGTKTKSESLAIRHVYDPDNRVIAVTGAISFLGTNLIRKLEQDRRYQKILAIDIGKPEIPLVKTEFHKIDLTQPTADVAIAKVLKQQNADTLVHLAFLSKPSHNKSWAHELEAIGTMHVLNACTACRVKKVIIWSLTALYGPHPQNPNYLGEESETRGIPNSRFFEDRIEAERLAIRFQKENPQSVVSILRTAPIIGPKINNYVVKYLKPRVVPVLMGYDPLVQLLHEEDAVTAFKLCVDQDFSGKFNLAGKGVLPLNTVLGLAGRIPVPIPRFAANRLVNFFWMTQISNSPPGFLDFLRYLCVADTSRSRRIMGFVPKYDIRQTILDFTGITDSLPNADGVGQ
ncbi:MAG: NAD-dependent epimerase/dehydratase family protein [Pseudomonadota bacterium]